MFYIVLSYKEFFVSLQSHVKLRWGLNQNVAFLEDRWFLLKIADMWLIPFDRVAYSKDKSRVYQLNVGEQ